MKLDILKTLCLCIGLYAVVNFPAPINDNCCTKMFNHCSSVMETMLSIELNCPMPFYQDANNNEVYCNKKMKFRSETAPTPALSKEIKKEMERFDMKRVNEFKSIIIKYLEDQMAHQQQLVKYWDAFIPVAKEIIKK